MNNIEFLNKTLNNITPLSPNLKFFKNDKKIFLEYTTLYNKTGYSVYIENKFITHIEFNLSKIKIPYFKNLFIEKLNLYI